MAKKEIRSKYIQEMMGESSQLVAAMQDVVEESARNFLNAGVKQQLKQVINEGTEDEFEIEEVPDTEDADNKPEEGDGGTDSENGGDDNGQNAETEPENGEGGETPEEPEVPADNGEGGEGESEDDIWNEIESYRNENGEYDLSKCEDGDCVARVLKVLSDEDGVRVKEQPDGTINLTDDNTQQEYIIDLNPEGGEGDAPVSEANVNLGYGPKQHKTAMTTPSNNEPANGSTTYSMDKGAPTGTENPIGHEGDKAPFNNTVSESDDTIEIELDETTVSSEQSAANRGPVANHTNSNPKAARGRNTRAEGEQVSGTGESSYSPQMESIMRKANAVFMENKKLRAALAEFKTEQEQMKGINEQLKARLSEAMVVMTSFGNMTRCMVENAMTQAEKKQLFTVLSKAKTIEESKRLCEAFEQRLRQTERPSINLGNAQAAQISESRNLNGQQPQGNSLNESVGTGMQESLSLIDRMDSVYGY